MSGTIAIRLILMLALVLTAHIFKPFSLKSVSQHIIYSARSFAVVLPDGARNQFDQANGLALGLTERLFGEGLESAIETEDQFAILQAAAQPQSAARIWTPDGPVRGSRKARPLGRKSAPAKRIERNGRVDAANIAVLTPEFSAEEQESALDSPQIEDEQRLEDVKAEPAAAAATLPVISTETVDFQVYSFSFPAGPDARCCVDQEAALRRMLAARPFYGETRKIVKPVSRPRTAAPECEGEKPDATEPEALSPKQETAEEEETEPESEQEEEKTQEPESRPSPLKCPSDPMDPNQ